MDHLYKKQPYNKSIMDHLYKKQPYNKSYNGPFIQETTI